MGGRGVKIVQTSVTSSMNNPFLHKSMTSGKMGHTKIIVQCDVIANE